jgi:hypothetical protein
MIEGLRADASVRGMVDAFPEVFAATPYVLVSRLDSGDPSHLSEPVRDRLLLSASTTVSLVPLLMTGEQFIDWAAAATPFTWFDEIWVFDAVPLPSRLRPSALAGTERGARRGDPVTVAWMRETACVLGVGDGLGLAFVATDRTLLERLDLVDNVEVHLREPPR